MKFFLLALLGQALLCAQVSSQTAQDAQQSLVSSLDKFTWKLYKHLEAAHPEENLFFSSYSIAMAFFLLSLGAKSETHQQILEGLYLDTNVMAQETMKKGMQHLQQVTNQHPTGIVLNVTNACFIGKEFKPLQTFLDDLNLFQSEIIPTDFQKTEEAKDQINKYVEKKTNGLIKNMLESLDPDTVMTLINAIYFKGTWKDIFNKNHTREEDFYVDKKTIVKVQMMRRDGEYPLAFISKPRCTVVEVPYNGNASAIFIIPEKGKLKEVEKAFHEGSLKTWRKELKPTRISLAIPRFLASATVDLTKVLPELGIKEVFTGKADLSGIDGSGKLRLSEAIQKTVVKVDEEGTEAAAVTTIGIAATSLPPQVTVDRPFLVTIADKNTNVNLFTGKIRVPEE